MTAFHLQIGRLLQGNPYVTINGISNMSRINTNQLVQKKNAREPMKYIIETTYINTL